MKFVKHEQEPAKKPSKAPKTQNVGTFGACVVVGPATKPAKTAKK